MGNHIAHAAIRIVGLQEPCVHGARKPPYTRRRNANHPRIVVPDAHDATGDMRICAEISSPDRIAQNDPWCLADRIA